jgi:hypothetical protein
MRKKKDEFIVSIPDTFNGEVTATRSSGTSTIEPLTDNFSNGELNAIKNKINEIIARL